MDTQHEDLNMCNFKHSNHIHNRGGLIHSCLFFNIILSIGWEMGWKGIKSIVYFIFCNIVFYNIV